MTALTGWGRYPRHPAEVLSPASPSGVPALMASCQGLVARGNGRAYGDAALGTPVTLLTRGLDRIRAFDPSTGRIRVEAGVLLSDLLEVVVPRGFFPPVVPGTKFVTIGGMGLAGTILEATVQLRSIETGWMRQQTLVAADLDQALQALQTADSATYCVAWIDCLAKGKALGRSLIFVAEHATLQDLDALKPAAPAFPPPRPERLSLPFDLPPFILNRATVAAFNEMYFRSGALKAGAPFLVPWNPYFFPLDGIGNWNRIYGRRGFLQYQCVVPKAQAGPALTCILERIARKGLASFLAVLKQLGPSHGTLSFPLAGVTLALDLPAAPAVFPLLDELDRIVVEAGGRLYLAKDARQSPATFKAGYAGLARFRDVRRTIGATGRIASRLSTRLGI